MVVSVPPIFGSRLVCSNNVWTDSELVKSALTSSMHASAPICG